MFVFNTKKLKKGLSLFNTLDLLFQDQKVEKFYKLLRTKTLSKDGL